MCHYSDWLIYMFSLIYRSHIYLCFLFLFPGLIYYPFFMGGYESYFSFNGNPYFGFLVGVAIFLLASFGSIVFWSYFKGIAVLRINGRLIGFAIKILVFLYFISSIYFFVNYSTSFRHKSRLSDAGLIVTFLFLIKPIVYMYVLMAVVYVCNQVKLGARTRMNLWLVLIGSLLSLNSSLQVLFPFLVFILLFFPGFFSSRLSNVFSLKGILILLLFPIIVALVLFVGIGNKVGYAFLLTQDGIGYLINFGNILFPRLSTSLFALVTAVDGCLFTGYCSSAVFDSFSATFFNRLNLLLGFGFDEHLIETVNRFNYLYVFANHADRAGASPGPLASMFYFPFYPLGFVTIPFLYAFIFSSVYRHLNDFRCVHSVFVFSVIYLLLGFFEAPLNIFYILDPAFFVLVFFIIMTRFVDNFNFLGR